MQCPWPHCRGIVYSTPQWLEHVSNFIFGSDTHHYVGNHVQAFALQGLKPFVYNRNQSLFTEIIPTFSSPSHSLPLPLLLPFTAKKRNKKERKTEQGQVQNILDLRTAIQRRMQICARGWLWLGSLQGPWISAERASEWLKYVSVLVLLFI